MKKYLIPAVGLFLIVFIIFNQWFLPGLITAGDFWPYYSSMFSLRSFVPYAWDMHSVGGMGGDAIPFLWIHLNLGAVVSTGSFLNLPWSLTERIFYLFPLLIALTTGPYLLYRKIFPESRTTWIVPIIYGLNSYILMIIGGGQLHGVGMAYSLLPFLLWFILKSSPNFRSSVILALVYSLILVFDIRFFYIASLTVPVFIAIRYKGNFIKHLLYLYIIPCLITVLLHSFWIMPLVLFPTNPIDDLGAGYGSLDAVKFFSFAKLENSISLLHPNWPENIFGKVGFMKIEFLTLPILAFASLFFSTKSKEQSKLILFFVAIALIGAFLAKGINDPAGNFYGYLFEHLPGFQMFRDPTKFYSLIALSYSILIPFTIYEIYILITKLKKNAKLLTYLYISIISLVLIFPILPALTGNLKGTFKSVTIPDEYKKLESTLANDQGFYRTLWIPSMHRYGYYSNIHPAVSDVKYKDLLSNPVNLQELGIKYVIVPLDTQGELFVSDRKYDNTKYERVVEELRRKTFLAEVGGFGKIKLFEVESPKDHFWSDKKGLVDNIQFVNPTKYIINISNAKIGDKVIFSESFDAYWFARNMDSQDKDLGKSLTSNPYKRRLNSFTLREGGSYRLEVFYLKQKYVETGSFIGVFVIVSLVGYLIINMRKNKKQ